MNERELATCVRDLAKLFGWRRYHTWLSKGSAAGFPDEVLVRPPRLVVAELKSAVGKLTPAQEEWLELLRGVPGVEVHVWRPDDVERIAEVLR